MAHLYRYNQYRNRLADPFEDLQDDFFLYLREGRQGMDNMPYRMFHSIQNRDSFESWLLSTWRNFLSAKIRKNQEVTYMPSYSTQQENERRIYVVSHLIAYADQQLCPKMRFICLRSLLTLLNKEQALPDREIAAALGMSEIAYRVTNHRQKANMRQWRDRLLNGEILQLDQSHQLMADAIDHNFENLYQTLMKYYELALNTIEQKEHVEKLRLEYQRSEGSMLHDGTSPGYGTSISSFWRKLSKLLR